MNLTRTITDSHLFVFEVFCSSNVDSKYSINVPDFLVEIQCSAAMFCLSHTCLMQWIFLFLCSVVLQFDSTINTSSHLDYFRHLTEVLLINPSAFLFYTKVMSPYFRIIVKQRWQQKSGALGWWETMAVT